MPNISEARLICRSWNVSLYEITTAISYKYAVDHQVDCSVTGEDIINLSKVSSYVLY